MRLRHALTGLVVSMIILVTALVWAAGARATPQQDGTFLISLGEAGIRYENSSTAIAAGKGVCSALDSGESVQEIVDAIDSATQLNARGALVFVVISVGVFCQSHGDVVREHLKGSAVRRA